MYFTIYKDRANEYRWTLYAANGLKIADSGEGYAAKAGAIYGIDLVKSTGILTPVADRT
jgi:uncharacterized protein